MMAVTMVTRNRSIDIWFNVKRPAYLVVQALGSIARSEGGHLLGQNMRVQVVMATPPGQQSGQHISYPLKLSKRKMGTENDP